MRIHIITPFYRRHLTDVLIKRLTPFDIEWHPICDSVDMQPFENGTLDWIHPLLVPPLQPSPMTAHRKCNDFIDAGDIADEDYYCFMGDDDMYEDDFFDVMREIINNSHPGVIICSQYRGNATPACDVGRHPYHALVITKLEDIRAGNIGMPQYLVRGDVLKHVRFQEYEIWGDGFYAEELRRRFPNEIVFVPDSWCFGGYFQPGRYTDSATFRSPTWRLPEVTG